MKVIVKLMPPVVSNNDLSSYQERYEILCFWYQLLSFALGDISLINLGLTEEDYAHFAVEVMLRIWNMSVDELCIMEGGLCAPHPSPLPS